MVVSHREPSISSNIRAIIEQLNLNPVERRRLIDNNRKGNARCKSFPDGIVESQAPKITIGVYGSKERNSEFEIPSPICKSAVRKIETEHARLKMEARQKFSAENKEVATLSKKEATYTDRAKKETSLARVKKEARMEHTNERLRVSIGFFNKDKNRARPTTTTTTATSTTTTSVSAKILPKSQKVIEKEHITRIDCSTIEDKDASTVSVRPLYKIEDRFATKQPDTTVGIFVKVPKEQARVEDTVEITRSTKDLVDRTILVAEKEDLPQLESASLSHTAAHHRISVRPKNRRPPRRTMSTTIPNVTVPSSPSIPPTIAENTLDSLEQKELSQQQQQQQQSTSNTSSPTEALRTIGVTGKSSSQLSRNSDIFEELEARLPRKPSATSLSPDSLDVTTTSRGSAEMAAAIEEHQQPEVRWVSINRRPSNRISKGSDVFEELEAKLPRKRSSSNRLSKSPDSLNSSPNCWFSKSTEENFDKLMEYEESTKSVTSARRPLINPISKSSDRVSKSSDSLEAIEPLVSDDSIERRQNSFDFRARGRSMSKSSESFDVLEQRGYIDEEISQELQKRSSMSDINLARDRRLSKNISKSSDNFDKIDMCKDDIEVEVIEDDVSKDGRQLMKRISSESSDNLDIEDRLENRRVRRIPKRIPSAHIIDVIVSGDDHERERRPTPTRKPPRLQKSSESSELGSTDTLDSERKNKSSESTETLDSLERDLEQDRKDDEITDSVVDKREKNDSWSSRNIAVTDSEASIGDNTEDSKSFISADNKYYWRQSSEPVSKENLGIQQLLAITIMTTRMTNNGNNQRSPVIYPKKKQQMNTSQPTSPVTKQEDTKMLFDNLLVSNKNDEDLQNMLNGNISEVSTDTKSFKEKLIMFEKLGK